MTSKPAGAAQVLPEIHYEAEGCLFGTWKNIVVAVWTTQGTGPLAKTLDKITETLSKNHPEGFSTIHVIAKGPPLPTAEARDVLVGATRKYARELACVGTVLEGSGFWASAVRSFIVGIRLVVPRTFEMQTYASVSEIASWIAPLHVTRTNVQVDSLELERVLVGLRRRLS